MTYRKRRMGLWLMTLAFCVVPAWAKKNCLGESENQILKERIEQVISGQPGEIGVAVIVTGGDTVTVNNEDIYPLMSMFKLQQAIAVCDELDRQGVSLDSVLQIRRADLDAQTWSPMLKDYKDEVLALGVGRLVEYSLVMSDNNTSNILFDRIISPARTDSCLRMKFKPADFKIIWRETDMKADHSRSYDNHCSPLTYAAMVHELFTGSIVSTDKQCFIIENMEACNTGLTRLGGGLPADGSVKFAHRTGSGYVTDEGVVVAVNDGGYVTLPSGKGYSIAVFVKDYAGLPEDAEKVIAGISRVVYEFISRWE